MPLTDYLDLESLRLPPASGGPAGVDLRTDDEAARLWREAREWRAEARQIERDADAAIGGEQAAAATAGSAGRPPEKQVSRAEATPRWRAIAARSAELLRDRSRDLTVGALMIEALARTDGFAGIAAGCDAARVLVEAQWADLFPLPDPEDGPADEATVARERVRPLVQLVGEDVDGLLVPAILQIPLVHGRDGEQFGLGHWRIGQAGGDLAGKFAAAAGSSDAQFLRETFLGLGRALDSWEALATAVAQASGDRAPLPTLPLRQLFEECQDAMRACAATQLADLFAAPDATDALASPPAYGPGIPLSGVLVPVGSARHDVLRILDSVADYFEHHDPHSLLAAQVRNVVRMARLSRTDYYRELILEPPGLQSVSRIAGLKFDEEP